MAVEDVQELDGLTRLSAASRIRVQSKLASLGPIAVIGILLILLSLVRGDDRA